MDWHVGQEVYVVPYDTRNSARSAKIVKIARKWIQLDPEWAGPISKEDGTVKPSPGYSPNAKAWPSKEAYEQYKEKNDMWRDFVRMVSYGRCPDHLQRFDLQLMIDLVQGKEEAQ